VRSAQGVETKPFQERFLPGEGRVHEEAGKVRVGEDLLDDRIASLRVVVRDPVPEDMVGETFRHGRKMTLLLVEETLPVRDEELEVPELRPVDGGVVDLGDDPVPDREPEPAGAGVGRADAVFRAVGPSRRDPRPSERLFPIGILPHRGSSR
jgi:hypothetical protein